MTKTDRPKDVKQTTTAGASQRSDAAPVGQSPAAKSVGSRPRRISVGELKQDSAAVARLEKYGVNASELHEKSKSSGTGTTASGANMRAVRAKEIKDNRDAIIEDHGRPVVSAAEVLVSLQQRDLGLDRDGFALERANGLGDLLGKLHFQLPFVYSGRNFYDLSMIEATADEKQETMAFFRKLPKAAMRKMVTPSPLMQKLAEEAADAEAAGVEEAETVNS